MFNSLVAHVVNNLFFFNLKQIYLESKQKVLGYLSNISTSPDYCFFEQDGSMLKQKYNICLQSNSSSKFVEVEGK